MVKDIDDVQGKEFGRQFLGPCNQMHTFPAVMIRSNIKQPFINRYRKLFKLCKDILFRCILMLDSKIRWMYLVTIYIPRKLIQKNDQS